MREKKFLPDHLSLWLGIRGSCQVHFQVEMDLGHFSLHQSTTSEENHGHHYCSHPTYHFKLLVQDFKSETVSKFFDAMNSTGTDFNGYVAMRARLRYLNDRLAHTTNNEINKSI